MAVRWGNVLILLAVLFAGVSVYSIKYTDSGAMAWETWHPFGSQETTTATVNTTVTTTYIIVVDGEDIPTTTKPNDNKYALGEDGKYRLRADELHNPPAEESNYAAIKKAALSEMAGASNKISEWKRKGYSEYVQVKINKELDPRIFKLQGTDSKVVKKLDDSSFDRYQQALVDESSEKSKDSFVWDGMTGLVDQTSALYYLYDSDGDGRDAELVATVDNDGNDGFRLIEENNDNLKDQIMSYDVVEVSSTQSASAASASQSETDTNSSSSSSGSSSGTGTGTGDTGGLYAAEGSSSSGDTGGLY
jgi:hypothetical protein